MIDGDVHYRDDYNFDAALEGNFGTGSLIQNAWIERTKVGLWPDSGTDGLLALVMISEGAPRAAAGFSNTAVSGTPSGGLSVVGGFTVVLPTARASARARSQAPRSHISHMTDVSPAGPENADVVRHSRR